MAGSELEQASPPRGELSTEAAREALREVFYPGLTRDIVSFGMVEHVAACNGRVQVRLGLRTQDGSIPAQLERAVTDRLTRAGATLVSVTVGAPAPAPAPVHHGTPDPWADRVRLSSAQHIIAVGAGKGGVGKSTVALNIALALKLDGLRVGLLDADIYGPSLPILLGQEDGATRTKMTPEKHIIPLEAYGLPFMSFGFFLGQGSPAIWRGPMVSKAVKQFARGVAWPELDVLVVDLPPGTGDVPLSLAQAVELSGAVVVTQAARVAAAEARKAVQMFTTLDVPVLGIVENMSGPFGSGTGAIVAAESGVPFLGVVPFDEELVRDGDRGVPTMIARPLSDSAQRFRELSHLVAAPLGWRYA